MLDERSQEKHLREWLAYCRKNYEGWYVEKLLELWAEDVRPVYRRVVAEARCLPRT